MRTTLPSVPVGVKKRRWKTLIVCVLLMLAAPAAYLWFRSWRAELDLEAALAETDALDPGWRLEDILAKRRPIPDERNAASQVLTAVAARKQVFNVKHEALFENLPATARLNFGQHEVLRTYLEGETPARAELLKLKDMPEGRFQVEYHPDWFNTPMDHVQKIRELLYFANLDVKLQAHEEDAGGAVHTVRAMLNASRSAGNEPSLIPLLVRIACLAITEDAFERVLAQTIPPEHELELLQRAIERELAEPRLVEALRGERAGSQRFFKAVREGRAQPATLAAYKANKMAAWYAWVLNWLPATFGLDEAASLRAMNQMVEAAKLPDEKHLDEFDRLATQLDNGTLLIAALPTTKVVMANLRNQAKLRCALVIVAAERYRQKEQRWPLTAEQLVEAGYLGAIPVDPFDGRPLRWKRLPDHLLVYSVGLDRVDNGGNVDRNNLFGPGADLGMRLWDPAARRQAPLPPAPENP